MLDLNFKNFKAFFFGDHHYHSNSDPHNIIIHQNHLHYNIHLVENHHHSIKHKEYYKNLNHTNKHPCYNIKLAIIKFTL